MQFASEPVNAVVTLSDDSMPSPEIILNNNHHYDGVQKCRT